MFESKADAREFAHDLAQYLDETETDGWLIRPTLDGVNLYLNDGLARVRGVLDSNGYRVRAGEVDESEAGEWADKLVILK